MVHTSRKEMWIFWNSMNNSDEAFFALVKAGLWEKTVRISMLKKIDFNEVYRHAEEQSLIGLVTAGMEHVVDVKVPQELVLKFVGTALQLEQQNSLMNEFIADIVEKMREAGIYTLLVKGQGVAQCYERPQWRFCGDVDYYLNHDNYEKAKVLLIPLAKSIKPEGVYQKHLNMTIDSWVVELHGSMRCGLSKRMDKVIDEIHHDIFHDGHVRSWQNGQTQVFLPSADNDVMIVFTHYLKHFFKGGIGLRQICDWCRLLWTYHDSINYKLLKKRLASAGLMSEWKAFGGFAVEYLGMPQEVMPLYSDGGRWKRKAKKIMYLSLKSAGTERRDKSFFDKYPYVIRKAFSFGRRCVDLYRAAKVFPMDSLRFFPSIVFRGLKSAARGE